MAKKDCLKSVRMTQEVFNYIDGFEGRGFNQKFENLVLFCMKAEEEKKRTLSLYDDMIDSRKGVLSELYEMQNVLRQMLDWIEPVSQRCGFLFERHGGKP